MHYQFLHGAFLLDHKFSKKFLSLSQRLARIAYEDEFDIGSRSLLDLLDSQNELFDTQRALVRAETALIAARATALAEAGELLSAFGVRIERADSGDWGWDPSLSSAYAACPGESAQSVPVDFDDVFERVQQSLEGVVN